VKLDYFWGNSSKTGHVIRRFRFEPQSDLNGIEILRQPSCSARAYSQNFGVYTRIRTMAAALCLVWVLLSVSAQVQMPWTFPGDFRDRLQISDLVVSGIIEDTSATGVQTVDQIKLVANVAHVRVDRVLQGRAKGRVQFVWYGLYVPSKSGGVVGSMPPAANFRPHERYLVFLKQKTGRGVVAIPLYAIEVKLAPMPPSRAVVDLSQALTDEKYQALAQELETAALLVPAPQPGLTGEAATYFPAIFDLLGGCAEPFYRRFFSSPSPELRRAALNWLQLIQSRHMTCKSSVGTVN